MGIMGSIIPLNSGLMVTAVFHKISINQKVDWNPIFFYLGVLWSPSMPQNDYLSIIPFLRKSGVKKNLKK